MEGLFNNISQGVGWSMILYKACEMGEDISRALSPLPPKDYFIKELPKPVKILLTAATLPALISQTHEAISRIASGSNDFQDWNTAAGGLVTGAVLITGAFITLGYRSPIVTATSLGLSLAGIVIDATGVCHALATSQDTSQNGFLLLSLIAFNFGREERTLYQNLFPRIMPGSLCPVGGNPVMEKSPHRVYGDRTSKATIADLMRQPVLMSLDRLETALAPPHIGDTLGAHLIDPKQVEVCRNYYVKNHPEEVPVFDQLLREIRYIDQTAFKRALAKMSRDIGAFVGKKPYSLVIGEGFPNQQLRKVKSTEWLLAQLDLPSTIKEIVFSQDSTPLCPTPDERFIIIDDSSLSGSQIKDSISLMIEKGSKPEQIQVNLVGITREAYDLIAENIPRENIKFTYWIPTIKDVLVLSEKFSYRWDPACVLTFCWHKISDSFCMGFIPLPDCSFEHETLLRAWNNDIEHDQVIPPYHGCVYSYDDLERMVKDIQSGKKPNYMANPRTLVHRLVSAGISRSQLDGLKEKIRAGTLPQETRLDFEMALLDGNIDRMRTLAERTQELK